MCLLSIVERPGVSWGVLGCPGVIRLTRKPAQGRKFEHSKNSSGNPNLLLKMEASLEKNIFFSCFF